MSRGARWTTGVLRGVVATAIVWLAALGSPADVAARQRASDAVATIGAIDGAPWEILDDVRGIVPVDGGVVVADGGSRQLRSYPMDGGAPRWTFGREGDGPGEFRSIGRIDAYRADSLAVWDPLQRRVTIVGPDGSLGRTLTLGRPGGVAGFDALAGSDAPAGERIQFAAAVTDGRFVARAGEIAVGPGDTTAVRRDRFEYVVLTPDGSVERSLITLPDDEQFVWAEGGSRAVQPRAFARTTAVAVDGSDLVFATGDGFRISRLPLDGGVARRHEAARSERPVRAEDERRWKAENAPSDRLPAFAIENRRRLIEAMPFPETFPAHGGLVVAADGSVWLEEYPADPEADRTWTRFAPDGTTRRVSFAPAFRLHAVDDGVAWGIELGEFDVQRVVAYRLPDPASARLETLTR